MQHAVQSTNRAQTLLKKKAVLLLCVEINDCAKVAFF